MGGGRSVCGHVCRHRRPSAANPQLFVGCPCPHPSSCATGYDDYPYITYDAETGNATGFLAPLLEQLCTNARLECEIAPVPALKDMIPWVQNVRAERPGGYAPAIMRPG